ncbi:FHA domain-containing protein, partial [Microbacterium sp.]|uniref:FHA domain-containing protein n=1 Tax=Microbacterium sp. TaxID=51671 RepID=UPI003A8B98A2
APRPQEAPPQEAPPQQVRPQEAPGTGLPESAAVTEVPGISADRPDQVGARSEPLGQGAVPRGASDGTATAAALVWDDGTRHAVYGRTLFGRNPAPEAGVLSAAVRDETLSLSKTHFEIDADDTGLWVVDRHSKNGVIVWHGSERTSVIPGRRTRVSVGDLLELGDRRATVEVVR